MKINIGSDVYDIREVVLLFCGFTSMMVGALAIEVDHICTLVYGCLHNTIAAVSIAFACVSIIAAIIVRGFR
ncbi:hypothetical protein UFOVP1244_126 [uncultured Caudovirales phage]|uniref:Uncharacterized protein n=1 Tax=uncultured Caudovirales phage TaxID=2100421 RepID=A0A6J5RM66_9CAUD|nr:hypothetical protein UFOVP1244_126 [uncultured Caudovirales phage]